MIVFSKRLLPAMGILFVLAGFFFCFVPPSLSGNTTALSGGDILSVHDMRSLEPGDFILRRGNGLMSTLIIQALGGTTGLSHAGVLYTDDDGFAVIHSVSRGLSPIDGVQCERLESFVKKSSTNSTVVVRVRASQDERKVLVEAAKTLLYQGGSFDREFKLGGTDIYCSELLWRILPDDLRDKSIQIDDVSGVIRFESFLDERYYERIVDKRIPSKRID